MIRIRRHTGADQRAEVSHQGVFRYSIIYSARLKDRNNIRYRPGCNDVG